MLPAQRELARRYRRLRRPAWLGTLRRRRPLSDEWGYDRGKPIDRYYIEDFLRRHQGDIRGRVLEVRESLYTRRFGQQVDRADVLDLEAANPAATIVADLSQGEGIPPDSFDCFILTQTLQYIADVPAALTQAAHLLRPGGVLLATAPALSRIAPRQLEREYWRFTAAGCSAILARAWGCGDFAVSTYGNFLACVGFLAGMAAEELSRSERDRSDPYFPLLVTVRATKRREPSGP